MLGAANDLILHLFSQVGEVSRVTGHPHLESSVFPPVLLGFQQSLSINEIHL